MTEPEIRSDPPAGMAERRGSRRYPSMTRAMIVMGEAGANIECVIRNVSETGALLVMPDATSVPETFTLLSLYHPQMPCRVVWRTGRRLGVQFGDIPVRPIGA